MSISGLGCLAFHCIVIETIVHPLHSVLLFGLNGAVVWVLVAVNDSGGVSYVVCYTHIHHQH